MNTNAPRALSASQPHWLIDDQGCVFDSRSTTLRNNLNAWHTGPALTDYTIRNMGFVGLNWLGAHARAALHISLRPSHITPAAMTGLLAWLAKHPARRVMLTWFNGRTWQDEVLGDSTGARTKLAALTNLPIDSQLA